MATRTGKVQLSDIKQGKTFFMVQADFPLVDSSKMKIGSGEVSGWVVIRPTGKPYYKGKRLVFDYINPWGAPAVMYLKEMLTQNDQTLLNTNKMYTPVFNNYRAAMRFIKDFEGRKPTPEEVSMAKHRYSLKVFG